MLIKPPLFLNKPPFFLSRTAACLVATVMVIGLMATISIRTLSAVNILRTSLVKTLNTAQAVDVLYRDVADSESGQRGYLLTQNPVYLQPYTKHSQCVSSDLAALMVLVENDPVGAEAFANIRPVVEDKMHELQTTVHLSQSGHRKQALALVNTDRGAGDMARIRTALETLMAYENSELLARRHSVTERTVAARDYVIYDSVAAEMLMLAAFLSLCLEPRLFVLKGVISLNSDSDHKPRLK